LRLAHTEAEKWRSAMEIINQFYQDTSGATMVEYALMITFIALAAIEGVTALGNALKTIFNTAAGWY
jgi:Flp pilus assembly pilin Flp